MRTRILPKMLNSEVQEYLSRNDIIIVPVGTTEMHGGFPLDCETVLSEALALKMAEACDGLVLTGLPYFYAGATASGRGTVQVSIRQGIDYLGAIARSLLRLGFKRQVYLSRISPESEAAVVSVTAHPYRLGVLVVFKHLHVTRYHNGSMLVYVVIFIIRRIKLGLGRLGFGRVRGFFIIVTTAEQESASREC